MRLVLATTAAILAVAVFVAVVMPVIMAFGFAATAATTTAATALLEVFRLGQTTKFDGLGDVILDGVAEAVHFFLRIEEAFRHWIRKQRVAA